MSISSLLLKKVRSSYFSLTLKSVEPTHYARDAHPSTFLGVKKSRSLFDLIKVYTENLEADRK